MNFLFLGLFLFSTNALAQSECREIFSIFNFEETQIRPVDFKDVDIYRRNNNNGVQQYLPNLRFQAYTDITPYSKDLANTVGLTSEGKIYHAVRVKDRSVARLLSGDARYQHFWLSSSGTLIGVRQDGRVMMYSPKRWWRSPVPGLVGHAVGAWLGSWGALVFAMDRLVPHAMEYSFLDTGMQLMTVFTGFGLAMSHAFYNLQRYSTLNTATDGFSATPFWFSNFEQMKTDLMTWEGFRRSLNGQEDFLPPAYEKLDPKLRGMLAEDINYPPHHPK